MKTMKFLCTLLLLTFSNTAWAQFDYDFESSTTGDTLSSLGFLGPFETETIGPVGVGGSQGVQIETADDAFRSAFFENLVFDEALISASVSIDAQYESIGSGARTTLFNLFFGSTVDTSDFVSANFNRNGGEYAHHLFNGDEGASLLLLPVLVRCIFLFRFFRND